MTEENLKKKILKTFEKLKQVHLKRKKQTRNLYFDSINQAVVCIKTSKAYALSFTQKYWYTLTHREKSFLENYKNSYVFLGCLDNSNTAYLIPFHKYKKCFLNCDTTQTGWHIRINHKLYWYFSEEENINLSKFEKPVCDCNTIDTRKTKTHKEKIAYDKGWHKRNSDCLKAIKKIKERHGELSKEINEFIEKLSSGQKV